MRKSLAGRFLLATVDVTAYVTVDVTVDVTLDVTLDVTADEGALQIICRDLKSFIGRKGISEACLGMKFSFPISCRYSLYTGQFCFWWTNACRARRSNSASVLILKISVVYFAMSIVSLQRTFVSFCSTLLYLFEMCYCVSLRSVIVSLCGVLLCLFAEYYCNSFSWLMNVWSFQSAGTLFCPPSLPRLSIQRTKVLSLSCRTLSCCIVASPARFAS